MPFHSLLRIQNWCCAALALLGCNPDVPELGAINTTCVAQLTGTDELVLLAQRRDHTLWVALNGSPFTRVDGTNGALLVTDSAASGSSADGAAIGCGVVSGEVWCFPLAGPLSDSTGLGAGPGAMTTITAQRLVIDLAGQRLSQVTQIAGGMNNGGAAFCAVTSAGRAWCWGENQSGLLGHGDHAPSSYARAVLFDRDRELDEAAEVRVGFDSTCARRNDGSVWCWGNNDEQQLGQPLPSGGSESDYAVLVPLPASATRLAASPGRTHCAILSDQRVACWGSNEHAQAGTPNERTRVTPSIVLTTADGPAFDAAIDLAPDRGMRAMCANTQKAGLWCWGDVLPDDTDAVSAYPIQAATSPQGRISVPLAAYGASTGKLMYINANGRLVLGAGNPASPRQPPCP